MALTKLSDDDAKGQIGQGIHTGLRKATDSPQSGLVWQAIQDLPADEWNAVLSFLVKGLASMGIALYEETGE